MATKEQKQEIIQIRPPNMAEAVFKIIGTSPLVVHRFSDKMKGQFADKVKAGTTPAGKKRHEGRDLDDICHDAKYIGETNGQRWEGFNATAIRNAMISACRLVNFKMTLAKMSVFVVEDGRDVTDPLYPLIRIYGKSKRSDMIGRTETDVAMLTVRPMYYPWSANVHLRWDRDQFSLTDVTNLLARVGQQVGICEGRPDSKNSAGMGWGLFDIEKK